MPCHDEPVIVRAQQDKDYEAVRYVYAEAFRRPRFRPPHEPGSVPPEVGLFEALWDAGDLIPEQASNAYRDRRGMTAFQETIRVGFSCPPLRQARTRGSLEHSGRRRRSSRPTPGPPPVMARRGW